mgnify:CR=1 FL=1
MHQYPVCVVGQGGWAAKLAETLTQSGFTTQLWSSATEIDALDSQVAAVCLVIELSPAPGSAPGSSASESHTSVPGNSAHARTSHMLGASGVKALGATSSGLHKLPRHCPMLIVLVDRDEVLSVATLGGENIDYDKNCRLGELVTARLRSALDEQNHAAQIDAMRTAVEKRRDRLTPRERQVMDLVVQGKLNKQIAAELSLSHKTIEVHRAHVMEKMQCRSLAELVRSAVLLENDGGAFAELRDEV